MREYNVHEVLAILQKYHITDSQQMVTRWIREGKLHGVRSKNRKEGYMISEEDLYEFIEEQRPGTPSMMLVYEDYISKLGTVLFDTQSIVDHPEETQEKDNITDVKEDGSNTENYRLSEQMKMLESRIIHLEEEKQKMDELILEIQEQNNALMKQNKLLTEEKNQTVQLNEFLNEEIEQLKRNSKRVNIKEDNKMDNSLKPFTQEKFLRIGETTIRDLKLNISSEEQREHLLRIYDQIYDGTDNFKEGRLQADGRLECPYTQKKYKQQKRLIITTITHYFEVEYRKNKEEEKTMINE